MEFLAAHPRFPWRPTSQESHVDGGMEREQGMVAWSPPHLTTTTEGTERMFRVSFLTFYKIFE
jgi:hypothetical protein